MFLSVDGGHSRISGALPPRGSAIDVQQLSGSRSQTFWQRLLGDHYEQDVFQ
jgi:hypothetical protein